ncbi:ZN430 protein, partial [Buphagus erythrorhynchus]|nr:ZN430 protein [Buphagus erythrorhynchus]
QRSLTCLECGQTFGLSSHLQRHRRAHKPALVAKCRDCGRAVAPPGQRPYKCVDCGKSFTRRPKESPTASPAGKQRQQRRAGPASHSLAIPNTCGECWQSFSQSSDLAKH